MGYTLYGSFFVYLVVNFSCLCAMVIQYIQSLQAVHTLLIGGPLRKDLYGNAVVNILKQEIFNTTFFNKTGLMYKAILAFSSPT